MAKFSNLSCGLKRLLIAGMVSLLSACLILGETAVIVSGELADENGHAFTDCSIDLFENNGGELRPVKFMKRQLVFNVFEFEQLFIIKPGGQKYTVEIGCVASENRFRSEPLDLTTGIDNPVNLGSIVLKRN